MIIIRSVIAAVALTSAAMPQGIVGSKHDFSSSGWGWSFMAGPNDEVCLPCHTPHGADATVTAAPLWNHALTTVSFTPYSSPTMNANPSQPQEPTLVCLSCHDGVTALNAYGGQGGTVVWPSGHRDVMGTDLSDDHPLSFVYDGTLADQDGGLHDPASTASGLGGTIASDLLIDGRIECGSCHDVHDHTTHDKMLRLPTTDSAICFTCHDE